MSDAALLKILKEKQMGLPSTYQLREVSICVFACVVRRPTGAARRIFSFSAEVEIPRLGGISQTAGKEIQNDLCSVKLAFIFSKAVTLAWGIRLRRVLPFVEGFPPGGVLSHRLGMGAHCAMDVDFAGVRA